MVGIETLLAQCDPKQKVNYHRLLLQLIAMWEKHEDKPRILLHSCCAPCSTYTLEFMCQHAEVTILFANSNIHPRGEYIKRSEEQQRFLREFCRDTGYTVGYIESPYAPREFCDRVKGLEKEREGGARCTECFAYRLDIVAQKAQELGFDYFGSTLTISPHKNSELINRVGMSMERIYSTKYLPSDFKKNNGYKRSIELCEQYDIYRQCYCGCVYSLRQEGEGGDE